MSSEKQKKNLYIVCFVLLMLLLGFMSFYKLTAKYVDPWDEARHGVNAYEMLNGGSFVQNTYLRAADYYNLKPPLSMWCIMAGLKLFSDPVFGLRFYSALCYLLLAFFTARFMRRFSPGASLLSLAFLSVNMTPFLAHMVRAGDADSLYVLLFSLAMMGMMEIEKDHRYLYLCGLCFSLAFLTKSFHALMIAAAGGIFLLLTKRLFTIRLKEWLLFLLASTGPVLIWAALRYRMDGTTFFRKMWETDVCGRTSGELTSNPSPVWYYASYYLGRMSGKVQIYLWALLLVLAALVVLTATGTFKKEKTAGSVSLGFALWILIPFVGFSAVSNKLLWYLYPSVTALMIAAAAAVDYLWRQLSEKKGSVAKTGRILFAGAILLMWVWYLGGTFRIVNAQTYNEFQMLIRAVAGDEKAEEVLSDLKVTQGDLVILPEETAGKGEKVMTVGDDGSRTWSQQDVFVAEAYGDFVCTDQAKDDPWPEEGILFAPRSAEKEILAKAEGAALLAATPEYAAYRLSSK